MSLIPNVVTPKLPRSECMAKYYGTQGANQPVWTQDRRCEKEKEVRCSDNEREHNERDEEAQVIQLIFTPLVQKKG